MRSIWALPQRLASGGPSKDMKVLPSFPTLITTGRTSLTIMACWTERIILDEVVLQPDDDAIHDRRGSISCINFTCSTYWLSTGLPLTDEEEE